MKGRLIAVVLALMMLLSMTTVQSNAAGNKEQELKNKIVTTYYRSLCRFGKSSFIGFCSRAVNTQIYYLGIETKIRGCDANQIFDQYRKLQTTSGGYPVRAYPASQYSLEGALDAISENGTRDVYNIFVGFQFSDTSDPGRQYGHAVMVYGILDGMVYFAECCPVMVCGRYCPEMGAITCTIEEFAAHYNAFAILDGVIWFGNNAYNEQCTGQTVGFDGMVLNQTQLLSDIPGPEAYQQPQVVTTVPTGTILEVTEILETPQGERWYEVELEDCWGYVEASKVRLLDTDEVKIRTDLSSVQMHAYLRKGRWFALYGQLHAGYGLFREVEVEVRDKNAPDTDPPLYTAWEQVDSNIADLVSVTHNEILWKKLPLGEYQLTIRAVVESDIVENGVIKTVTKDMELWRSDFHVVNNGKKLMDVTFDPCGGDTQLERTVIKKGQTISQLPLATREGFLFAGWYTEPEGGQLVLRDTVITDDMTLYARWTAGDGSYDGWLETESGWKYYRNGQAVSGWFFYNGLRFWQDADGEIPNGWKQIDEKWYYFDNSSAVWTGWLKTSLETFYLKADGTKATGWITIQGQQHYFDAFGKLFRSL